MARNNRNMVSGRALRRLYQRRMDTARKLKAIADSPFSSQRDRALADAAVEYAKARIAHEEAEAGTSIRAGRRTGKRVEEANDDTGEE